MKPEQKLQRECFNAFQRMWPKRLFIHIPNERKSKMECIWLKAQGTLAGCPDIFVPEKVEPFALIKYNGLWVELKCGRNKPQENQIAVMEALKARDYAVAICYSLDEFINVCLQYFAGKWQNQNKGEECQTKSKRS